MINTLYYPMVYFLKYKMNNGILIGPDDQVINYLSFTDPREFDLILIKLEMGIIAKKIGDHIVSSEYFIKLLNGKTFRFAPYIFAVSVGTS